MPRVKLDTTQVDVESRRYAKLSGPGPYHIIEDERTVCGRAKRVPKAWPLYQTDHVSLCESCLRGGAQKAAARSPEERRLALATVAEAAANFHQAREQLVSSLKLIGDLRGPDVSAILGAAYRAGLTLQALGDAFGLTRQRIQQMIGGEEAEV